MCQGQMPVCSVLYRFDVCVVYPAPVPPSQLEQMDVVEVIMAIYACIGRHVWMKSQLLEEKKLLLHLREELAPEMHGESRGATTEEANEMILEHLNSFLSHAALMVVGGNKLVGHI